MKNFTINLSLLIALITITFTGCRKRDALEADNFANFETTSQGIPSADQGTTIKVQLLKPTDRDISISLTVNENGVVYGTDYTTTPVVINGKIALTVPSGNNETSFTISKKTSALFDGDESVQFSLFSTAAPVFIGPRKQLAITFGEIVATNAAATINGGGINFPNKVFIDLSANRQTPVLRSTWDLGFYSGSNDFRVILNSSSAMMAKEISKNDLTQVTAADTIGFSADVIFNQFDPTPAALPYIDYPNGDLTRTSISAIVTEPFSNKVYIINRGTGVGTPAPLRGWKKIRVLRNASGGYTLQHADISSSTFTSIDIPKDDAHFFRYISFENGLVTVEPEKKKWDITWTYFSNVTNFGTGEVPYLFQDVILINRNVQIARVMTSVRSYDSFSEGDIAAQTFLSDQNAFASDWRSGGGPGVSPAIRTDRYYIVRDGDNNYYKLRFTALTQNGERGYPAFEAVLIRKG